jgi:hypothetical protein
MAERKPLIEALIVRIMKPEREMEQQPLILKVQMQLRSFHATSQEILARIQDLISREYLERDDTNANLLRYKPP